MSIQTEISRLNEARNTLRNKGVELGITTTTAKMDAIATAYDGIANQGAVSATVQEGDTYTIPKGYHNGSGTVSGVAGGGNYSLQSKTVTPTKAQQNVTPDSGYYGISDVTVAAIPEAYQDVTSVDAAAADVLANKKIVDSSGKIVAGTMSNNGAVSKTLDTSTTSYTVPKGYHSGSGTVKVVTETKTATPTKAEQDVTASTGKVLSKVTVAAIPDAYQDVTEVDATAADVLEGKKIVDAEGNVVEGTIPVHHVNMQQLDTTTTSYSAPVGYHKRTVVFIQTENKTAIPNKTGFEVLPDDGMVLAGVTVSPIPDKYQDVTGVTATASTVIAGSAFVNADGELVEGAVANNGDVSATIDGLSTASATIPAGYTTGGTVSLTDDIEEALAAI